MPVLVTSRFDDDLIKNKVVIVSTTFSLLYVYGKKFDAQGHVTLKQIVRSPEMELVHDFMPVLVIGKLEEDPIKAEGAIVSTAFFPTLKGSQLRSQWTMWPDFELVRDFIAVLVTCKFNDDTIKNEGEIASTTFSPL